MTPTKHAALRWKQRFPEFDMAAEYASSRGIGRGKRFRKIVQGLSATNKRRLLRFGGNTYMLFARRSMAVFVMAPGEIVITVLRAER